MAAAGRLWRRAPAWRVCLITALATTALVAMFPPKLPAWVRGLTTHAAPPTAGSLPPARFVPQTAPAPPNAGLLGFPPPGVERSGVIPLAGRQLPLPTGKWQAVVLARSSKPIRGEVMVFSRVEEGALTGLLAIAVPDPLAEQTSPFDAPQECLEPNTIESFIANEPLGQDPLTHECWRLGTLSGTDFLQRAEGDGVLRAALARLREQDARLPDRVAVLDYLRSEPTGFVSALLFLPDREQPSAAERKRLVAWVRRYVAALHEGFDGKLHGPDLERDPA